MKEVPIIIRRVLWEGATQEKVVDLSEARGTMQVTPRIVLTDLDAWQQEQRRSVRGPLMRAYWQVHPYTMGIVLACQDVASGEQYEEVVLLMDWYDPIRWWRTMRLLEALPRLEERVLPSVFWAADRDANALHTFHATTLQEALGGQSVYEALMGERVPQKIVGLLIEMANSKDALDLHHALSTASEEIEVGTLRWSADLKRIGVKHPTYWHARQAARQRLVAIYEPWLTSYAEQMSIAREAMGMLDIEAKLVSAIDVTAKI